MFNFKLLYKRIFTQEVAENHKAVAAGFVFFVQMYLMKCVRLGKVTHYMVTLHLALSSCNSWSPFADLAVLLLSGLTLSESKQLGDKMLSRTNNHWYKQFVLETCLMCLTISVSLLQSLWTSVQTISSSSQESRSVWAVTMRTALLDGRWRGYRWCRRRRVELLEALGSSMVPLAWSQISPHYQIVAFTGVNTWVDRGASESPSLYQVEETLYAGSACLDIQDTDGQRCSLVVQR